MVAPTKVNGGKSILIDLLLPSEPITISNTNHPKHTYTFEPGDITDEADIFKTVYTYVSYLYISYYLNNMNKKKFRFSYESSFQLLRFK